MGKSGGGGIAPTQGFHPCTPQNKNDRPLGNHIFREANPRLGYQIAELLA